MANTFHCPSCFAPLDHQHIESLAVKCPYCGTSVIVPDSLRQKTQDPAGSFDVYTDQSLSGLMEVAQIAHRGHKIEAIKRYRELFNVPLKDAKDAVDQMTHSQVVTIDASDATQAVYEAAKATRSTASRVVGCIFFLAVLIPGILIGAYFYFSISEVERFTEVAAPIAEALPPELSEIIEQPADLTLQFGQEGVGPGHFNDTRFITVDGDGHIYTADYNDGRIQRFDASGTFVTTWNSGAEYTSDIAATRHGELYVKDSPTTITIFDGATGAVVQTIPVDIRADLFTLAPDDTLIVYESNPSDTLIFYDRDLNISRTIPEFLGQVDDDLAFFGIDDLVVDGAGSIFAMTREEVLKFNSEGKFQGRPAISSGEPGLPEEPDLLFNAQAIAVDGRGRLYVADWSGIKIYDTNDRYLETIPLPEPSSIPFSLDLNDRNHIFVMDRNGNQVLKYELKE